MLQPQARAITGQARRANASSHAAMICNAHTSCRKSSLDFTMHDTKFQDSSSPMGDWPPDPCPLDGPRLAEARLFHFILACILLHRVLFTNWRGLRRILQAIKSFGLETEVLVFFVTPGPRPSSESSPTPREAAAAHPKRQQSPAGLFPAYPRVAARSWDGRRFLSIQRCVGLGERV